MRRNAVTSSTPTKPLRPRWLFPAIFLAALVAYWPALSAGFIWDDVGHVTREDLRSFSGLFRIWFEPGATQQYYPLLHSAFWLEHRLWGDSAFGYHLVNILLHAANACLFGTLLRRLAIPGAGLAAFLFALHPVCVESVAWISEQKNTLSTLLYLTAALAYLRFHDTGRTASGPSTPHAQRSIYLLATALFIAALLTKTVTATLPAALLVIQWWRSGRLDFRRDVVPLLPWFALAAAAGLFTAHFEAKLIGAQGTAFDLTFVERLLLAGRVPWFYLGKLLWPANLTFIYPRWSIDASNIDHWLGLLATFVLLTATVFAARRAKWGRGALTAILLFGGTLFPVLGFFNVYPFLFSYVADHFQYLATLPLLALFASAAASAGERLFRQTQNPTLGSFVAPAALLLLLAFLTFQQSRTYRDPVTLWETTLERNPSAWIAHNNLAVAHASAGRVIDAIPHLEKALQLRPDYARGHGNLGDALLQLNRPAEAVPHLETALRLQPNYYEAHNTLGSALLALNRTPDAIAHFESALRLNPDFALAHRNLGFAIASSGQNAEAIPHFLRAIEKDPRDPKAELSLAIALMLSQRFDEAIPHFERATALAPGDADIHLTFARALAQHSRLDAAINSFRAALALNPSLAAAHLGLAQTFRRLGRTDEAQHHFLEARALHPSGN